MAKNRSIPVLISLFTFATLTSGPGCSLRARHRGSKSATSARPPQPGEPPREETAEASGGEEEAPPENNNPPARVSRPARNDRRGDPLPPGALARLGTVRFRATAFTNSIAASPDGKYLAAGHIDGHLRLFELDSGKKRFDVLAQADGIKRVGYLADGTAILTAGEDGFVRVHDPGDGRVLRKFQACEGEVRAFAVNPRGGRVATGGFDKMVRLFDAADGRELAAFKGHSDRVDVIAFSGDGRLLASGGYDGTVLVHGADAKGTLVATIHPKTPIYSLAISADGKTLAAGGDDTTIAVYELPSGKQLARWKAHTGGVTALAFASNDKELVSGGADGRVRKWDAKSGRALFDAGETVVQEIAALAVINAGARQTVATAGAGGAIRFWSLESGRSEDAPGGHNDKIGSLAFSPDGAALATGAADGRVRIFDVAKSELTQSAEGAKRPILALGFIGQDSVAAVGFDGATLRVDARSGSLQGTRPPPKAKSSSTWRSWAQVSGDGRSVAQLIAGVSLIFHSSEDSASAAQVAREVSGAGVGAAFLRDGTRVSIEAEQGALRVVDAAAGKTKNELEERGEVTAALMSPDGAHLYIAKRASSSSPANQLVAFDLAEGVKRSVTLASHDITKLALSPDGKTLVAGGGYTYVRARRGDGKGGWRLDTAPTAEAIAPKVLDAATLRLRGTLLGHDGGVESIAFSPDGTAIATGGDDTTVLIWSLAEVE